ncbi:hypothetical protein [Leptospira yasudae]|uniref:hypothetical protein n=1 Tax=Leptospira yasudae TaxID=2202201 RepID=UPI0010917C72|nr:hypothetical protein [Leptospira yasudae]TGM99693.1 hypothetical protein EHR10_08865 [Leptospira yasudae]
MKKSLTFGDFQRLKFQNQFTVPGTSILNSSDRQYFLTHIHASGPWTIHIKGNNADSEMSVYDRKGSGDLQFFLPLCASEVSFTGVSEVSGFWINATRVSF